MYEKRGINPDMQAQHRQLTSMGTRLDMVFPGMEADACDAVTHDIKAELERIEDMLSIYRSDSEISLLNRHASAGCMTVSPELRDILNQVKDFHRDTGGYFDITLKPVGDFWKDNQGKDQSLALNIREKVGMERLLIEKEGVRFSNKGVFLDLGGYGKGYAIKKILPIMEMTNISCALLSFGESLIYGLGSHPYGDCWKVSIPNGDREQSLVFELKDEALSTSGNSLNNQKKFADSGHIVNPVTFGMAIMDGLVSVKAKDPVRAEVFSTALFSSGPEGSKEILKRQPGLEINWVSSELQ
jgi:thiamine biosynthesis lipoprotein